MQAGSNYFIELADGVITDLAGNNFAGISDAAKLNFTTIATTPLLTSSQPLDEAPDFQADDNIEFIFNEGVVAGSGSIVISNGTDSREININDASQVTFGAAKSGDNTVTINPTNNLLAGSDYFVQLTDGVITDFVGNNFTGISDETTLNFTVVPDITAPLATNTAPADGSVEIPVDINGVIIFNEPIQIGAGNITVSNGLADIRVIPIADSQVSFGPTGDTLILDLTDNLLPGNDYFIQWDAGIVTDLAGNGIVGVSDETSFNFTRVF